MTRRQQALAGYAGWVVLLVILYYLLPGWRVVTWTMIGLSGVLAMVAGVLANRPARPVPWLLLAGANLSFAAGQMIFLVFTGVLGQTLPFPSVADAFYLASYPLYAAGLLIFIHWRSAGRDRRSLLDALTLTVGLALLSWIYLILPYARNPALTTLQKATAIAYPLGDVLVLAMLARLLAPGGWRTRSLQLLAVGTAGLLVSDVAFGLIQLNGEFQNGTAVDLGWAIFYGAWGAAALHPTMTQLTRPVPQQVAETSPIRLGLLMLASLIAPGVLFVQALHGPPKDASVIAVFSALLFLLVLSRLADTAASHRQALGRERVLRVAGASLASVVTVEQVADAVRAAVAALTGPQPERDVLLAVRADGALRAVGAGPGEAAAGAGAPPGRLAALAIDRLPLLAGSGPRFVPAEELTGQPGPAATVLLCPLLLSERPAGEPLLGALAVCAPERVLAGLFGTLEILAGQATLAVERLLLSQEVNRRNSEAYFRTLVHDASDIILIVNDDGRIRYATPSAAGIFGEARVEGACLWDLVSPDERGDIKTSFAQMREGRAPATQDWRLTRPDGSYVEVEGRCSDLREDATVGGLVLTLRDVTGQRQLERELKHRAFHDSLTGLPNRLLFHDRAAQACAHARRSGMFACVLLVDLDDFKIVNDTMGHTVGDELLVAAGLRLSAAVRQSDTVARLGGDEFALLIENVTDTDVAEAFAEQIVRAFSEPFTLADGSVITTATVGIATTADSIEAGEVVRHADLALYAAKAAGKRQWRRYQPVLSAGLARRRELQAAIDDAIAEASFTLVYQPIVTLTTGEVAGFEALVRWPHPRWGMIQPDQFIALAEETGHIVPLGSWVMERAAADATAWQRQAPRETPVYVSVNVSARQIRDPGFVTSVRRVLAGTGLPPSTLVLELTESVLLRRDERIRADLEELKQIGVRLAIDDFGTGYSSLSYLRELPIDVLKIDKSFVDGIGLSKQRLALAEVIIRIAKTLGLLVMAEGIENERQRDLLISMGCQFGQGYFLARPVSASQAETLLRFGRGVAPELPGRAS